MRLVDRWSPSIYVEGRGRDMRALLYKRGIAGRNLFTRKFLRVQDEAKRRVLRISVENLRIAERLARRISRLGGYEKYQLYNVDIPSSQRYLYEKNLFPLPYVKAISHGDRIEWELLDSVESLFYEVPPYGGVSLKLT